MASEGVVMPKKLYLFAGKLKLSENYKILLTHLVDFPSFDVGHHKLIFSQ